MSLGQLLQILRARFKVVIAILVSIVLLAVAISLALPKQYVATATVLADIKADPVAANNLITTEMPENYIATQVDVINSERVARRAVEILRLDQDTKFRKKWQETTHGTMDITAWLAQSLRQHLDVAPSRESNVINIGFRWTDPQEAAKYANAFAQSYIDTDVELKVAPAKQYSDWFKQRAQALSDDLAAKQQQLADFQRDKGIVATDERLDTEVSRLGELSTQLVQIQGQHQDSQSRQRQRGKLDAIPEVLQSPVIAALKQQLSISETKLSDLRNQLGPAHPDYVRAESEVADLQNHIVQESMRIVGSMNNTAEVNQQRENAVRVALDEQKTRVIEMKHQRDQAAILEGAVQTAQRNLDAVNQRLAQTSLESTVQQTTVVLLTVATPPFRHSSPRLSVNLIIAMFLGVILGVSRALYLESKDRLVRSAADLSTVLGVQTLGTIRAATAIIAISAKTNVPTQRRLGVESAWTSIE
jgi:chain length determinant protein EpsF